MSEDQPDFQPSPNVLTHDRFGSSRSPGALKGASGGGTSDGMDAWQQTVETRLGELRGDIRQLFYSIVGGAGFLLVAFAAGFLVLLARVDEQGERTRAKLDGISQQVSTLSERVARMEGTADRGDGR